MKIAIYGTGGVGGVFGAQLARAGEDVTFIARGAHLEAMRASGLHVSMPESEIVVSPVTATDDPGSVGEVDAVLLCTKTWQVTEAGRAMAPMVGPDTVVVTMQNGVEAADELAAVLGDKHVLPGLCGTISWVEGPGRIKNIGGVNFIRFNEMDSRGSDRAEALRATFEAAGIMSEIPEDIDAALWQKFLFNAPTGGIGAVTRAPVGVLRSMPQTRAMLEAALHELVAVGRARGVAIPDGSVETMLTVIENLPADATTSMQRDIMAGRSSELEAWNGAVVRLGRAGGVPTPTHDFIYGALLPMESRARGTVDFA